MEYYIIGGIFGLILIVGLFCRIKKCIKKRILNKRCKVINQPLVPDNQTLTTGYNSQISNPPNTPQSSPGSTPQDQPEYIPPNQQQYISSSTPINQN